MSYRIFFILGILLISGCALPKKIDSIQKAADANEFQGIDGETKFSISFPNTHSGPYESVDQINFTIEGEKNASALVAKLPETGTWEVLTIMVEEDGQWITIPRSDAH